MMQHFFQYVKLFIENLKKTKNDATLNIVMKVSLQ